ncbi:hypothetical protein ACOJTA_02355 [Malaciobacter sp. WC5094]
MSSISNWGHVYGIIFNKFKYENVIKSLQESKKNKEVIRLGNEEGELLFISNYKVTNDGYCFLIGRTNEEVSKTKFDTKTFKSEDIDFLESEHISDYTHIFISRKTISKTGNSHYLLVEKNQRIQIGSIKKLIGGILGYKSLDDKEKSKLFIGSILQSDYIKKLLENEIIGKQIIINETKKAIIDLPDSEKQKTETKLTQISRFENGAKFLNSLNFLINNPKSHEDKDVLLIVDDGKTKNKKIPLHTDSTKYVPFFQLPFYIKSVNKDIHEEIVDKFINVINTRDYETI